MSSAEAGLVDQQSTLQSTNPVSSSASNNNEPTVVGTKRERLDDDDDDDDDRKSGRERRKIEIKFISDKSRRHITFSKRKAGIMKKAYELSVLTGTQVLLLVVSETGLVYTFTTPKLQPLVTKPEGKNLIQACLNAPEDQPQQQPQQSQSQQSQSSSTTTSNANANANPANDELHNGHLDDQHLHSQQMSPQQSQQPTQQPQQPQQPGMPASMYMNADQAVAYNNYLAMPNQRYNMQHPHLHHN
jgi:pheromone receptor transcription factor